MPDRISFTRPAVARIASVVRAVENARPAGAGLRSRAVVAGGKDKPFKVCTFTGAWAINTAKVVTFRNVTSTPNTVSATNLIYDLPSQGTLPCNIAKDGTAWYLVSVKHTTADIITNVTLGTAGLVFTRLRIQVASTATSSVVTVGTTACT
jgi:hypothetical protein